MTINGFVTAVPAGRRRDVREEDGLATVDLRYFRNVTSGESFLNRLEAKCGLRRGVVGLVLPF